MAGMQVRLQAVPERACLLVAHPLMYGDSFFNRTVVMLCRHSLASGTYGLVLNRLMSSDAKSKVQEMVQGSSTIQSSIQSQTASGLDLARDMSTAIEAMMGVT